jgi:hypothetical protein
MIMVPLALFARANFYSVISVKDLNLCSWDFIETNFGTFLRYAGDPYYLEQLLYLKSDETVKNQNCFLVRTDSSTALGLFIQRRYTDNVWAHIGYHLNAYPAPIGLPLRLL